MDYLLLKRVSPNGTPKRAEVPPGLIKITPLDDPMTKNSRIPEPGAQDEHMCPYSLHIVSI